jgi:hypothetical protein
MARRAANNPEKTIMNASKKGAKIDKKYSGFHSTLFSEGNFQTSLANMTSAPMPKMLVHLTRFPDQLCDLEISPTDMPETTAPTIQESG